MADTTDLKSVGSNFPCGFESHPRDFWERRLLVRAWVLYTHEGGSIPSVPISKI